MQHGSEGKYQSAIKFFSMTNDEKQAFDADLNALLEKYRIKLLAGFYISHAGIGEQEGMTAAGVKPFQAGFTKLMAISPRMLALMEEVKPFF